MLVKTKYLGEVFWFFMTEICEFGFQKSLYRDLFTLYIIRQGTSENQKAKGLVNTVGGKEQSIKWKYFFRDSI